MLSGKILIAGILAGLGLVFAVAGASSSEGPSPEAQKVAQPIREAVAAIRARLLSGAEPSDLRAISTAFVHVNDAGEIQVYVILTEFRPDHVAQVEAVGLRVELMLPDSRLVQGWVPANAVDLIAGYDFVAEVKPPGYPVRRGG